ncbi:MAG: hypothetical protein KF797_14680, partial [Flavobacteriales bacterium]|nr:hypothetical protein [Flavobacteriales bacterium]
GSILSNVTMAMLDRQLQRLGREFEEKGGSVSGFTKCARAKRRTESPLPVPALPYFPNFFTCAAMNNGR